MDAEAQQGEEDEQETNVIVGESVAEGEFNEENGGNDSDGDVIAGSFDSPDDASRRSLV